jgi:hypothetical protein
MQTVIKLARCLELKLCGRGGIICPAAALLLCYCPLNAECQNG